MEAGHKKAQKPKRINAFCTFCDALWQTFVIMTTYRFLQFDVFTDRAFCGNPLAVFPEAEGIPTTR
jgi:hypothetical protein